MAGVTVRALHHYDRLGLLKPERADSGYRLYQLADLERLEQIIAFKFLGVPLKQIKTLLSRGDFKTALRLQSRALQQKRRLLDQAIAAIAEAESATDPAAAVKKIIEVIEMHSNTDWMRKYSADEAWSKIKAGEWSPELQERVTQEWTDLFRDVEASLDEDPASEKAQALAARWMALIEAFTKRDAEVTQSVRNLYADSVNWPAHFQRQMEPFRNRKVWEYMGKALAVRKR